MKLNKYILCFLTDKTHVRSRFYVSSHVKIILDLKTRKTLQFSLKIVWFTFPAVSKVIFYLKFMNVQCILFTIRFLSKTDFIKNGF